MHIVNAAQMRELDRAAIEHAGIPGIELMEHAGRGTADYILRTFPRVAQGPVAVLCGVGNNGGDGFVIARCLHNAGAAVCAVLTGAGDRVRGDARISFEAFRSTGGRILEIAAEKKLHLLKAELEGATLIVDALLGTGLSKDVTGLCANVISLVNSVSQAPVVAVDIPSGVDATTGRVCGCAVRAHSTCTFCLPKYGHVLYPGADCTGTLSVIDIGIPDRLVADAQLPGNLQDMSDFESALPARAPDTHKGDFGHVLLLAGSIGRTGAAVLGARSAMRTGAGLVTVASPEKAQAHIAAQLAEPMSVPLADCGGGLAPESLQQIIDLCAGSSVLAMGPGLGTTDAVAGIVTSLVAHADLPLVIDADALTVLARDTSILRQAAAPVILTPHPGEMARLAGTSSSRIQADRIAAACCFSREHNAVVVLKGARTVIAAPDGRHWINTTGNSCMAGAGMGDVLTGMIASLLTQGLQPLTAARMAVCLHGHIADMLVETRGRVPIIASEIIDGIPQALRKCTP